MSDLTNTSAWASDLAVGTMALVAQQGPEANSRRTKDALVAVKTRGFCGDDQVVAVTGQSPAMVLHYTKKVRQRVRALQAQKMRDHRENG